MHIVGRTNYGPPSTPREVRHLRVATLEHCLTHGQPVVWRHRFLPSEDVYHLDLHGVARQSISVRQCPACFDSHYGQPRNDCPVCFGVGYASVETEDGLWIVDDGQALSDTDDGSETPAPRWRGFGPPVLTWMTQPDVVKDRIRWDRTGAYVDTQQSRPFAPWYPAIGDGDLMFNVTLDRDGYSIASIDGHFQTKSVQPQTVRGSRPRGHSSGFAVGQTFEAALIPSDDVLSDVTHTS